MIWLKSVFVLTAQMFQMSIPNAVFTRLRMKRVALMKVYPALQRLGKWPKFGTRYQIENTFQEIGQF